MNFCNRTIYPLLLKHLDKKQITVLTGMRRTGKTTLVKQIIHESPIRQKYYFDLERMDTRSLFSEVNYEIIKRFYLGRFYSLSINTILLRF